jgi:hypothetical protein
MKKSILAAIAVLGLMAAAAPAFAHHAAQAEFDFNKFITITGTVTRVEFINPHGYLYIDEKNDNGKVRSWAFELVGPAYLRKAGLGRGTGAIKIGDIVTVSGASAKDGSDAALAKTIKLADGRTVTIWTSDPNQ